MNHTVSPTKASKEYECEAKCGIPIPQGEVHTVKTVYIKYPTTQYARTFRYHHWCWFRTYIDEAPKTSQKARHAITPERRSMLNRRGYLMRKIMQGKVKPEEVAAVIAETTKLFGKLDLNNRYIRNSKYTAEEFRAKVEELQGLQ